jgi:plastocyanin
MRAFRLLLRPILVSIVAGCSSNTTGTTANNPPPPPPLTGDIQIVPGASTKGASAFSPDAQTVAVGTAVRWINGDITGNDYMTGTATTHHIVSNDGTSFDTGLLTGNAASASVTLAAGNYPYHCSIHPTMVGTVHVGP